MADIQSDFSFVILRRIGQDGGAHVGLLSIPGSAICPVAVVGKYLGLCPAVAGSFLVYANGTALSIFQFVSVLQRCLSAAGIEVSKFSLHSFHIGAATEAARWGLDNAVVKRIDRWKSDRFKLYVRPPFGLIQVGMVCAISSYMNGDCCCATVLCVCVCVLCLQFFFQIMLDHSFVHWG